MHWSINDENTTIRTDLTVHYETTHFQLRGSILEIEGYASIKNLKSFTEDRIRKSLLLIPEMDVEEYKQEHLEEVEERELSDQDIINLHTIEIPLENHKFTDIKNHSTSNIDDKESLGGFKVNVDLSSIQEGKPLTSGDFVVYLQLIQYSDLNDNTVFVKRVPIADIKKFLKEGMVNTYLEYFSSNLHQKYNLMASFDLKEKTLRLENKLLQSFNPKEYSPDGVVAPENRYMAAIKRRFFKLWYILFCLLPINKKKITMASDSRSDLSGNLYFVYEELYHRGLDLNIKLILNERIDNRKSFLNLFITAYHFATSKIIMLDDFYPLIYPLSIRRKSDLIQIWHAAGAFKTFGFSRMGRPGGPSPNSLNHRNYTKATVSSEGVREHYAEGFGISLDKVYATGVPRSDIFFDENYKSYVTKRLQEMFPFIKDKKVILFAPTFRGNGQGSAYFPFHMLDLKKLYENFSDEYVFLFKIHPFVNNKLTIPYKYADFFYDLSDFREINDLLLITDILITDYSSVCFEFALLNKPMIFFGFDVEEYIRTRDFYYDFFDFIPGPLVRNTDDMIKVIKEEDFEMEKIKPFVEYFFSDNLGKASATVVDEIIIPSLDSQDDDEEKVVKLPPPKSRIELFERTITDNDEENET